MALVLMGPPGSCRAAIENNNKPPIAANGGALNNEIRACVFPALSSSIVCWDVGVLGARWDSSRHLASKGCVCSEELVKAVAGARAVAAGRRGRRSGGHGGAAVPVRRQRQYLLLLPHQLRGAHRHPRHLLPVAPGSARRANSIKEYKKRIWKVLVVSLATSKTATEHNSYSKENNPPCWMGIIFVSCIQGFQNGPRVSGI